MPIVQPDLSVQQPSVDVVKLFESFVSQRLPNNPQLKEIGGVYQFNLARNGHILASYILDVNKSSLHRGNANENHVNVNAIITIDEPDALMILNDVDHTYLKQLFIKGKLKIKGTRIALEKFQQLWVELASTNGTTTPTTAPTTAQTHDSNDLFLSSIPTAGIKSDVLFFALKKRLPEEQDVVNRLNGVLQFNISKDGKIVSVWTMDFTRAINDIIYPGEPLSKSNCILTISDDDLLKLMLNKLNPQKAFMMGKLNVKGNILYVYKLFTVWIDFAIKKGRGPELVYLSDLIVDKPMIYGLRSEVGVCELIQHLVRYSQYYHGITGCYYFDITKNGQVVSKWKLDFDCDSKCGVFSRLPIDSQSPKESLLTIDDDDFTLLAFNRITIEQVLPSNNFSPNFKRIFSKPIISKL